MNRIFPSLCSFALAHASLCLTGCPALQQVQIACESSFDCPTDFGCGPNRICAQGIPESTLAIEPGWAAVALGATANFTAKLDGQSTTSIDWSVEGKEAGTIDSSGKYTAPSATTIISSMSTIKVKVWAALKRHPSSKTSVTVFVLPPDNTVAWVMSYFQNGSLPKTVAQDSLHLAYSTDGLQWIPLAPSAPVFQLTGMGSNHLRDPFILRKQDGTFVLLAADWTRSTGAGDYWSSPSPNIVVVDSADLITFTNPRLLRVTPIQDPSTGVPMHAWAPQAFYDFDLQQYGIFWAGNDASNVNRIYVSYTNDFQTLVNSNPTVFFDPGYSVTDATLVRTDDRNYLLFKDESDNTGSARTGSGMDIQIARTATTALTPNSFNRWSPDYITRGSDSSTRVGTEGPYVVKFSQSPAWMMCADLLALGRGNFGCWRTDDLGASPSSWSRVSANAYTMPPNAQHASTVRVTQAELDALIAKYGTLGTIKIKSTYVDSSSRPHYLTQSWFHGIATYDTDTTAGQVPADFNFKMWTSLANSSDGSLVSFSLPGLPGYWLRINSATPTAWPTGGALTNANQAQYLSGIPEAQKNHLLWADPNDTSPRFALDATFKVVKALNGDSSMVSLRWCGESADGTCNDIASPRYLCYSYAQIFARQTTEPCGIDPVQPSSSTDVRTAMSFTIVDQK